MTIDERLDRLVERHEALSQTVELLTRDIAEQSKQIAAHSRQLEQDAEHIRALVRIAEIHNARLERLEGNQG